MAEPSKQRDSSRESWIFTHFPRSSKKLHYTKKRISFAVFDCAMGHVTADISSPLSFLLLLQIGVEWNYCYYAAIHSIGQLTDRAHIHSCYVPKYIFTCYVFAKIMTRRGSTYFPHYQRSAWNGDASLSLSRVSPLTSFPEPNKTRPWICNIGGSHEFSNSNTKSTQHAKV